MPETVPTLEFLVEPYQSGLRVDMFLCQHLRNYTLWQIQRLVHWKAVTIEYQPAHLKRRLWTWERVQVRLPQTPEVIYPAEPYPLEILFEDPWLLAVNKPPGIIAHPTGDMQTGTLCHYLQHHLDQQTPYAGLLRPGIVHRLDRETSGILLVAKTHYAHRQLVDNFEHSRVAKTYLAIVEGHIEQNTGTIDLPIGQATKDSKVLMTTRGDARNAKPARTHWQVLQRFPDATVVAAKPVTGRNHQIRVHFAAIGHPLLGDEFYAAEGAFKPAVRESLEQGRNMTQIRCLQSGLTRHALHAIQIEVAHPITGALLKIRSGLPIDLLKVLLSRSVTGAE